VRFARRLSATLLAVLLAAILPLAVGQGASQSADAAPATTAAPVTVTLNSMTPRSPDATDLTKKVTFVATVTNTSDTNYADFAVGLERGVDLHTQSALDAAIASPPATNNLASSNDQDQRKPLLAHASAVITYVTDASSQMMCLCVQSVYPYALVVQAKPSDDAGFAEVGRTQVLVPAFLQKPQPVQVTWIWPLIDRPHRAFGDTVFTDDLLAASVAPGGRLDRALQSAELVAAGKVRMTLVVDPELLDSLAVMASKQGYQVRDGSRTVAGTGGPAAQAWLDRLAALGPRADLALTAYGDPDINAVTRAGLPYSTALDPQVQARIAGVTSRFTYNAASLTWPAGGALTSKALDATISAGSASVVLSDAALPGQNGTEPRPNAISPLPSASGQALALVTDSGMEESVAAALKLGASPALAQQTLLSQLAIRAVSEPNAPHFVLLAPDRYVDTDPAAAAATVLATVRNAWTSSLSLAQATSTVSPVDRGSLQTSAESAAAEVSATQLDQAVAVEHKVASLREALSSSAAADLLGGFNTGLLRAQSSAWRTDRVGGAAIVTALNNNIDAKLGAVSLVRPAEGTYSLSSANSPLLVTVQNRLSQDVTVRVSVDAGVGVIGFRSPPLTETISAGDKRTISIPTHVDRLGQFKVTAHLTTPDGQQLGQTIELSLRSTSLGGITKVITIVAAAVLIAALLRRAIKRIRLARSGRAIGRHA
jgi:hypothetical protein